MEQRLAAPRLVLRARFSSLNPLDLQSAYANLGEPDRRLSDAVEARKVIDLKLGVVFSRFITMYMRKEFRSLFEALDVKLISYGPCQVPALWFVVKRHDEVAAFAPEPYWEVQLLARVAGQRRPLRFLRQAGALGAEAPAERLRERAEGAGHLTVTSVSRRAVVRPRPLALNTVRMLQKASSRLRQGAQRALGIAEDLYLAGLITYPRTETTRYPERFDAGPVVSALAKAPGWLARAAAELSQQVNAMKQVIVIVNIIIINVHNNDNNDATTDSKHNDLTAGLHRSALRRPRPRRPPAHHAGPCALGRRTFRSFIYIVICLWPSLPYHQKIGAVRFTFFYFRTPI